MKVNFGLLLSLTVLAVGVSVAPAQANPTSDRASVGPAILAQRSERAMQNPQSRSAGQPIAGRNYVGAAGSNSGAVFNGKYALSNRFSVRPNVFTSLGEEDDRGVAVLAPVTYDFAGDGERRLQPFVGAGAGISTDDQTELELVTTAGVDYRLGNRYILNGSVNYLPIDEQRVDFVAGLGYRF